MNKHIRWLQTEAGRSPITGTELVEGPTAFRIPPYYEWSSNDPEPVIATYHAQMIRCGTCAQLLDPGESCEHLAFEDSPEARIRVLQAGIYQIGWRSFSPSQAARETP